MSIDQILGLMISTISSLGLLTFIQALVIVVVVLAFLNRIGSK